MSVQSESQASWITELALLEINIRNEPEITQDELDSVVPLIDELMAAIQNMEIDDLESSESSSSSISVMSTSSESSESSGSSVSSEIIILPPTEGEAPAAGFNPPDFTQDGTGLAIVLEAGEERVVDGLLRYTTIHGKPGSTLTALPGAEFVKVDLPLDTGFDPDQFGHGLLIQGTANWVGSPCRSYSRATGAIRIDDTSLRLKDSPDGWRVSDEIVIANTQQDRVYKRYEVESRAEVVTITAKNGTEIRFTPKIQFDHPLGPHGETPHVGRLTHDVKFRSENPDNPGHIMFMAGAEVLIENCEIDGMSRTRNEVPVDITTYNPDGSVAYVATNRDGRRSLHCHKMGDSGSRVEIRNNSIRNSRRIGIAIHGTNSATVVDNVIEGVDGSGIFLEDQTSYSNHIARNLIVTCTGLGRRLGTNWGGVEKSKGVRFPQDMGWIGCGIWAVNRADTIEDNVISDAVQHGIIFTGYGQNLSAGPWATVTRPVVPTHRNEVYASGGHTLEQHPQGVKDRNKNPYKQFDEHVDLLGWHLRNSGFKSGHVMNIILRRPVLRNDPRISELAEGNSNNLHTRVGIALHFGNKSYDNGSLEIIDPIVEGWNIGFWIPVNASPTGWAKMMGGRLKNFVNVLLSPARKGTGRQVAITDTDFQASDMVPLPYLNTPKHSYDVYGSEEDGVDENGWQQSSLDLIGYRDEPVTVFIPSDPAATCADTDERIKGFVCDES